jgi:hypothetical protein
MTSDRLPFVPRLNTTAGEWRRLLPRIGRTQRMALFDRAMAAGERHAKDERLHAAFCNLAWYLNDATVEYHQLLANPIRRLPWSGRALATARRKGKVPVPIGGVHIAVCLRSGYELATGAATVVIDNKVDFMSVDFGFAAGLNLEILATGSDLYMADWLAWSLAAQCVETVTLRRLDLPAPVETLYDGRATPWLQS